jgi:hypothetical protein
VGVTTRDTAGDDPGRAAFGPALSRDVMGEKRCAHGNVKSKCAECDGCAHGKRKRDCVTCTLARTANGNAPARNAPRVRTAR